MSASTELRARKPWRLDQAITYSGNAYRRSAPVAKHVARAHSIDDSRARRYRLGDVNSPLCKALAHLATCALTTAFPALTEAIALVLQIEVESATHDELVARRAELVDMEHDLERDENRATCDRRDDALIEAHIRKAECHLELAAIIREQRERRRRA